MTGATTAGVPERGGDRMSSGEQLHHPAHNHGNSVAAWTAVSIIMLGALVSAIAFPLSSTWLFWAGIVVIVLGVVAGKVLAMMGFGVDVPGHPMESATVTDPPA
jgi:hypothetical protein